MDKIKNLVKMLTKEDFQIVSGSPRVELDNKIMYLPTSDIFSGLIDHECGHILFSPRDVSPSDLENVIEDMRVEELLTRKYPGSISLLNNITEAVYSKLRLEISIFDGNSSDEKTTLVRIFALQLAFGEIISNWRVDMSHITKYVPEEIKKLLKNYVSRYGIESYDIVKKICNDDTILQWLGYGFYKQISQENKKSGQKENNNQNTQGNNKNGNSKDKEKKDREEKEEEEENTEEDETTGDKKTKKAKSGNKETEEKEEEETELTKEEKERIKKVERKKKREIKKQLSKIVNEEHKLDRGITRVSIQMQTRNGKKTESIEFLKFEVWKYANGKDHVYIPDTKGKLNTMFLKETVPSIPLDQNSLEYLKNLSRGGECFKEYGNKIKINRLIKNQPPFVGYSDLFLKNNVAVRLLVDMSESVQYYKQVFLSAIRGLSQSMNGFPLSIAGFTSNFIIESRDYVFVYEYKSFNNPVVADEYIPNIWGATPLYLAVYHSLAELQYRPEPFKLLLILTDGYGNQYYDEIAHTDPFSTREIKNNANIKVVYLYLNQGGIKTPTVQCTSDMVLVSKEAYRSAQATFLMLPQAFKLVFESIEKLYHSSNMVILDL